MRLRLLTGLLGALTVAGLNACGSESQNQPNTDLALAIPADTELASLYQQTCMGCHANAMGKAPITGDKSAWQARMADYATDDQNGFDTLLTHTIEGYGGMPPLGSCADCDLNEFTALIEFMIDPAVAGMTEMTITASIKDDSSAVGVALTASQQQQFQRSCSGCHTYGAGGAPKVGDAKVWQLRGEKGLAQLVANTRSGIGIMPAKGLCADCSDDDFAAIIQYMAAPVVLVDKPSQQ